MTRPEHIKTALGGMYELENLLRVLALAVDGANANGITLERAGGASIIDMAADMAGKIAEDLEASDKSVT